MLSAATEQAVRHAVALLQPDWGEIADIQYLEGGYSNANYTFRHGEARYVLRMPERVQPYVDRKREHGWYQRLSNGLSVKPLVLDTRTGHMIVPWIEGELLIDAWPGLDVADLLDYLARLHRRLPVAEAVYDVAALAREFWQGPPPFAPTPLGSETVTCHNDLNPWNVIVTPDGWITLDWEFAGRNDPLFDLVTLHQGLALPAEELPPMAAAFLAAAPGAIASRLDGVLRNFWLRELGWAEYQMRHGNVRQEVREQAERAKAELQARA